MRDSALEPSPPSTDIRPMAAQEPPPSGFQPLQWLRTRLFTREATPQDASAAAESRGQALRAAFRSLRQVFEERPALRLAMPHLAQVERALGRRGSRALSKLPVLVMRRGLEQLEQLQAAEPRDALRTLRARLVEAIDYRTGANRPDTSPGVLVSETTQSQFEEVERSWTGRVPLDFETEAWADTAPH